MPDRSPLRILLVEDDAGDALLVADALDTFGLAESIFHVEDGDQALTFLQDASSPRPDLVLLDLNLPRVSGHTVLSAVKNDQRLSTIPVVVFSTSSNPDDVQASYGSHANAYVVKPQDIDGYDEVIGAIYRFFDEIALRSPAPAA
ncbi:response regulator [Catellatospora sichuanensis]|uniref:response regulator n=1 Tax=Catellatospora sichuanensis TaxID=1969805 RepID=UPI001182C3C2|nr:response regulator [Catellatospora sichuanensis]